MATFYANPNDTNEPWIEQASFYNFRNWHVMFFCFSSLITLVILIFCCIKFRIPRTKQEFEGDYKRRKLAEKFQEKLRQIQKQEIDVLDLQQALKLIQEDFDKENRKIQEQLDFEAQRKDSINEPLKFPIPKFADIILTGKLKSQSTGDETKS